MLSSPLLLLLQLLWLQLLCCCCGKFLVFVNRLVIFRHNDSSVGYDLQHKQHEMRKTLLLLLLLPEILDSIVYCTHFNWLKSFSNCLSCIVNLFLSPPPSLSLSLSVSLFLADALCECASRLKRRPRLCACWPHFVECLNTPHTHTPTHPHTHSNNY